MGDSLEKLDSKALSLLESASKAAADLTGLWPLTEARHLDNDAKYAENLEVRSMRAIARILTNLDVTVPDAEFVYEGADEIPGRPQEIVDALLASADAYDNMDLCYDPHYEEISEESVKAENESDYINTIFSKLSFRSVEDADALNSAADTLGVAGNWESESLQTALEDAKEKVEYYKFEYVEAQKITVILLILHNLISKTNDIRETLPIFLYINEVCECAEIPRMMFKDVQWHELVDCVHENSDISVLIELVAPLLTAEWEKHKEDVLWDPEEAKKRAKEEDDRKSREALAAKFAHVEGNKEATQALD